MKSTIILTLTTLFLCVTAQAALTGSNTISIVASDNACVYTQGGNDKGDQNEATGGLKVKESSSASGDYQSWLRFNVSTFAEVKTIYSATLKLYVIQKATSDARNINLDVLNDGGAGETNWTSTVSWYTDPTGATTELLGNLWVPATGSIMSFNLTAFINNLVTNDTNGEITFRLSGVHDLHSEAHTFAALENTGGYLKPTLEISADFGPPKGTVIRIR